MSITNTLDNQTENL